VKSLQTTDDGRQVMAIVHLDLWSRWTKKLVVCACVLRHIKHEISSFSKSREISRPLILWWTNVISIVWRNWTRLNLISSSYLHIDRYIFSRHSWKYHSARLDWTFFLFSLVKFYFVSRKTF
jgi:hypothetical protein